MKTMDAVLRVRSAGIGVLSAGLVAAALSGAVIMAADAQAGKASAKGTKTEQVQRGEYLVTVGGCNDCHTPLKMGPNGPEPDMSRMLSGHPAGLKMAAPPKMAGGWMWAGADTMTAFAGPWGISYAFNLTPDPETGLGNWTEENFVSALKSGKHMGVSRPILPPMPWQGLSHIPDADLKAIWAFLKTIPPIKNKVPDVVPPAAAAAGTAHPGPANAR